MGKNLRNSGKNVPDQGINSALPLLDRVKPRNYGPARFEGGLGLGPNGGCVESFMSADDDRNAPQTTGPDAFRDTALSERLARLSASLQEKHEKEVAASRPPKSDNSGFAKAFRLSADFLGGIIAGGLLGWIIDRFVGTSPFGLLVFVLLGFGAGTLNVIRTSQADAATGTPVAGSQGNHSDDAPKAS